MTDTVRSWLTHTLGDYDIVGAAPQTRRRRNEQPAYELVDADGGRWFVKQPHAPEHWRAEVDAYHAWVPALDNLAPTLRDSHESLRALVTSKVPGRPPVMADPKVQRQCGRILRLLHGAAPGRAPANRVSPPWHPRLTALLEDESVLTHAERLFVRHEMAALRVLPRQPRVPCHGDFQRHNLLQHPKTGKVRVIDFGNSRWDEPVRDMTRLYYGRWWARPRLAQAFLRGYGRELTDLEVRFLECFAAIHALQDIGFGVRHQHPAVVMRGRGRLADLMTGERTPPRRLPPDTDAGGLLADEVADEAARELALSRG